MCCKVKHFPSASDAEPSASISALQSVESFMAIRLSHLGQKSGLKEEPSSVTLRLDSKHLRVHPRCAVPGHSADFAISCMMIWHGVSALYTAVLVEGISCVAYDRSEYAMSPEPISYPWFRE